MEGVNNHWRPLPLLRVLLFNPKNLLGERAAYISSLTGNFDLACFPGTAIRASPFDQEVTSRCLPRHHAYQWNWAPGRHTNKSAGLELWVGRRYKEEHVTRLYSGVPASIRGRVGAIRIRSGGADIIFAGAYFPPFTGRRCELEGYLKTIDLIIEFLIEVMLVGSRTTLRLLATDLNDGLGLQRREGGNIVELDRWVGTANPKLEGLAATSLRNLLKARGLAVVNTFIPTGPTWFGPSSESYIDHIAMSGGALPAVTKCVTLRGLMAKLQAVHVKRPDDHVPMMMEMHYLRETAPPQLRDQLLDRDSLMLGAARGFRRYEFVADLEQRISALPCRDNDLLPDRAWSEYIEAVKESGLAIYGHKAYEDSRYAQLRSLRLEELARRRTLKMRLAGAACDQEEQECASRLRDLTQQCRYRREKAWQLIDSTLGDDIWRAADQQRFAEAHRLRRLLSKRSLGVRGRNYKAPIRFKPNAQEWIDALSLPGAEGGDASHRN